ncbi:MAG: HigA family addiction module antidote protein [Candidatus Accumulibacter sp.]|uniref:HigA family addiction module antidote protein n=1 Tax=Candidatus Accumulibacter affinis TaxID=2954384 RepID=A0A935W2K1_9PROT|nr:HigA family addiction module antidote protein [Candidatus Accumulibacter affinis]
MTERQMAEVFPPGDILKEELEARGWTQTDLAEIIGKSARLVNEVIAGKRAVTPDTARALADAFGTSAQFWMNLESAYQLSRLKTDASPVTRRARLYSLFPVKEMIRRGWVSASESLDVVEAQFCNFFGLDNLDAAPQFNRFAARRTHYTETEQSPMLTAWLFRARQIAQGVGVGKFSDNTADTAICQLKTLMSNPEDIRHVPRVLADAGIRFVLVEPFPGMKLDGVCFWLDMNSPVVAMTLRFDRIDNFWFVLMHELRHVANKDGQNGEAIIDENLGAENSGTGEKPEYERVADSEAAEAIIPATVFNDFALRVRPLYSEVRISGFAARIGVHPGIVVGQLHNRKEVPFAHYRKLLVKVKEHLVGNALTDGWGHHAPMI